MSRFSAPLQRLSLIDLKRSLEVDGLEYTVTASNITAPSTSSSACKGYKDPPRRGSNAAKDPEGLNIDFDVTIGNVPCKLEIRTLWAFVNLTPTYAYISSRGSGPITAPPIRIHLQRPFPVTREFELGDIWIHTDTTANSVDVWLYRPMHKTNDQDAPMITGWDYVTDAYLNA